MPSNTSGIVKTIVGDLALGPRLSQQVTFPNDPIRGQDVHTAVKELFPNDPVQPPGPAIHDVIAPDASPILGDGWML